MMRSRMVTRGAEEAQQSPPSPYTENAVVQGWRLARAFRWTGHLLLLVSVLLLGACTNGGDEISGDPLPVIQVAALELEESIIPGIAPSIPLPPNVPTLPIPNVPFDQYPPWGGGPIGPHPSCPLDRRVLGTLVDFQVVPLTVGNRDAPATVSWDVDDPVGHLRLEFYQYRQGQHLGQPRIYPWTHQAAAASL